MLGEKIDYERIRRIMHFDLQELHGDVFKIREEIRHMFRMQLVMYSIIKNDKFVEFSEERKKERKKEKNKKQGERALKSVDDIIAFDEYYSNMIKDAEKELRQSYKDRMDDYKSRLD